MESEKQYNGEQKNFFVKVVDVFVTARNAPFIYLSENPVIGKAVIYFSLFVLYNAYLIGCIVKQVQTGPSEWEWCDGIGFLIIITGLVYLGLFYFHIFKPLIGEKLYKSLLEPVGMTFTKFLKSI